KGEADRVCYRCHSILHFSATNLSNPLGESISGEDVRQKIPPKANVVHVIDAYDLPASLLYPFDENDFGPNDTIVVNRADLLCGNYREASQRLRPYALNILNAALRSEQMRSRAKALTTASKTIVSTEILESRNLPQLSDKQFSRLSGDQQTSLLRKQEKHTREDNVHIVSARKGWGLKELVRSIPERTFFFGFNNVGKSRLIRQIISLFNADLRNKKKDGPGSSFIPGMTREKLKFDVICGKKVKSIIDLPGVENSDNVLWKYVKPEMIKQLVAGRILSLKGREHKTIKPGQCLNIGGLIYVKSDDASLIAWPMIGEQAVLTTIVNSSFERAKETVLTQTVRGLAVTADTARRLALAGDFRVDGGGIDVVVRGVGYVELRITGKIPEGGAQVSVYVPEGVNVLARRPISESLKPV
ncbi:uncharacterized protein V1510DRAFT_350602, partial [Dipodascopsis tothii]|uniref:uncharacterized protein n=1 Tax=Dipodascopsis tothii TaxID=44089 RepID=UPI0034CE63DB